jgi:protein-tyrosine phosphatase
MLFADILKVENLLIKRVKNMNAKNEFYIFDLGNLKNSENRVIRSGLIYRSAALYNLSDENINMLKKLNIKNVIDLREGVDSTLKPDKIRNMPGFRYWNLQMQLSSKVIKDYCTEKLTKTQITNYIVDNSSGVIRSIFEVILKSLKEGSVVFHCNHGRTKAGLTSILLLGGLGVDAADIEKSYNRTYGIVSKDIRNLSEFRNVPADVRKVIKHITDNYGSIYDYLTDFCDISEETLNEIKAIVISD